MTFEGWQFLGHPC